MQPLAWGHVQANECVCPFSAYHSFIHTNSQVQCVPYLHKHHLLGCTRVAYAGEDYRPLASDGEMRQHVFPGDHAAAAADSFTPSRWALVRYTCMNTCSLS